VVSAERKVRSLVYPHCESHESTQPPSARSPLLHTSSSLTPAAPFSHILHQLAAQQWLSTQYIKDILQGASMQEEGCANDGREAGLDKRPVAPPRLNFEVNV
jgi:hypothetical protein